MDENTKNKVLKIIRDTINNVVYDEVKRIPETLKKRQEELKKTKAQKEQDVHNVLFGDKANENTYRLRLHESTENPKITVSEIENFEKEFTSRFPNVSFYKQTKPGQNGQIVDFPVINGQKDAVAKGVLKIDKDFLVFSMSLLNGLTIQSSLEKRGGVSTRLQKPFEINDKTKDVFGKLFNLYKELFQKKFEDVVYGDSNQDVEMPSEENVPNEPMSQAEPPEQTEPGM